MKYFSIGVIAMCAFFCAVDLMAGAYGWALFQGAFCALNIWSYRRSYVQ